MFAKFAKIRALRQGRVGLRAVTRVHAAVPSHANDNRISGRGVTGARGTGRPVLVCRWLPVAGGKLECRWAIEHDEATSPEDAPRKRDGQAFLPVSRRFRRHCCTVHDPRLYASNRSPSPHAKRRYDNDRHR